MKQGCCLVTRIQEGRCKTMLKMGATKKPTWAYPRVTGFSPPERWGHSCCHYHGLLYIFGGCYGGLHFGEVVALDLKTLEWRSLQTSGEQPGSRDSHSAVIIGERMVVFGGTNGSKKINCLHVLDLQSGQWTQPAVEGNPPSSRESHSATLIGDSKMVIFGGSGEGKGNYLNDVHVLDVKAMKWVSPEVGGEMPAKRDSHTAVAVGNKVVVYGGDCGDHYLGDVDILDLFTFTWSRMVVQSTNSPGVRAGHASVSIGNKVYIIGGVGDRAYYNDVWILDINCCTWIQVEVSGTEPQGRFSHTAVLVEGVIAIYGGCGEDERPVDETIFLLLGREFLEEEYSKKIPSTVKMSLEEHGSVPVTISNDMNDHFSEIRNHENYNGLHEDAETDSEPYSFVKSLNQTKRRKTAYLNSRLEVEGHQAEQQSQQSSPSEQSEQDPARVGNRTCGVQVCRQHQGSQQNSQIWASHNHMNSTSHPQPQHFVHLPPAVQLLHVRVPQQTVSPPPSLQSLPTAQSHDSRRAEAEFVADQLQRLSALAVPNMVGAEVRGIVDAAFDSGYLMTAQVNGCLFRGLLFSPPPGVVLREPSLQDSRNNDANPGIIVGRPVSRTVQPNLSDLNAALVQWPLAPQLHFGTAIHPTTLVRTIPIVPTAAPHAGGGEGGPNIAIRTAAITVPVPSQDARCDASSIFGGTSQLSNFGSPRRNVDDARVEPDMGFPFPSNFQTAMSGQCRWVWQPLYTGCPPESRAQAQMGNDSRITVVRGGHVEIETSASENGTTLSDLQEITLRIGGPEQLGDQKH